MIHSIRYNILLNLKNIPGWRTNRKIVVIECDDWAEFECHRKMFMTCLSEKD